MGTTFRPGRCSCSILTGMQLVVQYFANRGQQHNARRSWEALNMTREETADASAVQVSRATKGRSPRPRGHVTLFGSWCKGCGICIEFCPQGVFETNGQGRPVIVHEERCTACHWCDTHCPDMAIAVRRLRPEEVEELQELTELAEQGALPAGGDL